MSKFLSPAAKKFYVIAAWALAGSAVQAGLLPASVVDAAKHLINGNELTILLAALGVGHVLPAPIKG